MLKKKSKVIALLIMISLSFSMFTACFADEENPESDITTIQEDSESTSSEQETVSNSETTLKKEDVYLAGDNITIDYLIDGNLFVVANTVTINSQIGGDAFILAKSIVIEENGYIFSNLFAASQKLDIKGVVYDIYSTSNDVSISGFVYRDLRTNCKTLNLSGTIGRNAFISCNTLNFPEEAQTSSNKEIVNGNLNYKASQEASIPEGTVSGDINFTKNVNTIQNRLNSLVKFLVTVIIIWLVALWISPKFIKQTIEINSRKVLLSFSLGVLVPILMGIVSTLLIALGFTSSLGIILFALLYTLISISTSIFIITINNIICNKFKIDKKLYNFGMLVVTTIVLWILSLIPILGTIIGILAIIFGLGNILNYLLADHIPQKGKITFNIKKDK